MKTSIKIDGLKCCCAGSNIKKELATLPGVYRVEVDMAGKTIEVEHTDEVSKDEIVTKLKSMGHKEATA